MPLPNDPVCVGQFGDEQGEADNFAVLSWAHTFTNNAVLTSSLLYHFERADYDGGAGDYPTITTYHHSSQYEGGEEQLKWDISRNHLDVGVFGFAQQDQADFNLAFTDNSSPTLRELESPTGGLIAAWVQDTFEVTHWLNLSAGVRQSHFQGSFTENATDPRLGATVLLPRLDWVLSAFWGKYYQAPPLETLSGPLVAYATSNDTAFLPLHGERDTERLFGVTIPVKGWTIEADYFVTESTNFFDHNPLGESDIYLPITDQGALIEGRELTVRSPAFWPYGQVHLAYSNQTAECFGSITGGLVVPGTACGSPPIALDHDQRNTLNLGYNGNLPQQFFVGSNLSVNSGLVQRLPAADPPAGLRGARPDRGPQHQPRSVGVDHDPERHQPAPAHRQQPDLRRPPLEQSVPDLRRAALQVSLLAAATGSVEKERLSSLGFRRTRRPRLPLAARPGLPLRLPRLGRCCWEWACLRSAWACRAHFSACALRSRDFRRLSRARSCRATTSGTYSELAWRRPWCAASGTSACSRRSPPSRRPRSWFKGPSSARSSGA